MTTVAVVFGHRRASVEELNLVFVIFQSYLWAKQTLPYCHAGEPWSATAEAN